ncbi:hypothetical protein [Rhizobium leguminosarum]|uniref:hypothetical protein n=1 Tax=Rhizobium leguminosarum TaxID=384 RepID=UPI001C96A4A6|nr:hypothetical protein [Rhizobium leguminosarum]MBY5579041.1 hypothetical protein [Rhizobium leguminosarum]
MHIFLESPFGPVFLLGYAKPNIRIIDANGNHVDYATVPRKISYLDDYGRSGEDRKSLIAGDRFYFFNSQHFEGHYLLFYRRREDYWHPPKQVDLVHEQRLENVFPVFRAKHGKKA